MKSFKQPITCLYHANCLDGFAAATIVHEAFNDPSADISFHACEYQREPLNIKGGFVIMVDFSYKRSAIIEMAKDVEGILILDHHVSAMDELVDLPDNVTAIFDIKKCGAVLAWDYFFNAFPIPPILKHIQDNDLWLHEFKDTRAIVAFLYSLAFSFDDFSSLIFSKTISKDVIKQGRAIERTHSKIIKELANASAMRLEIGGYIVPVANSPKVFASDLGHELARQHPFAAVFSIELLGIKFSLRSREGGVNVAEIAKIYGGGGHKHAAGFMLLDNTELLLSRMFPPKIKSKANAYFKNGFTNAQELLKPPGCGNACTNCSDGM